MPGSIAACIAGLLPDCSVPAHTVILPTQYGNDYGAKAFGMVGVSPGCAAFISCVFSLLAQPQGSIRSLRAVASFPKCSQCALSVSQSHVL